MEIQDEHWRWLLDSVRYFRAMDFFALDRELTDEVLAQRLVADELERCREHNLRPFWARPDGDSYTLAEDGPNTGDEELDAFILRSVRPRPDYKDLLLVAEDAQRVWWEDGEDDIKPEDKTYVKTIQGWSVISRGAFLPTSIREVWDKPAEWPDCTVIVLFDLNGQEHILEPWDGYGWIDFTLTEQINALIADSGYFYERLDTQDQTTCIMVLTAEEKRRLIAGRGWEFA